jgi:predicted transglutaminase-like cysteine proteinase
MRATSVPAAIVLLCLQPAVAFGSGHTQQEHARFARSYSAASPPHGFVRFCKANPQECTGQSFGAIRIRATADRLAQLDDVNRAVNRAIEPVTDRDQFGVEELWTMPSTGKGDCEEYVLLKRKRLREMRWASSTLLITVVRDENDEGHAVLTVRTDAGDFILDNRHDDIRLWSEVPYTFVMRQSYLDPMAWVSLIPGEQPPPVGVANVKRAF